MCTVMWNAPSLHHAHLHDPLLLIHQLLLADRNSVAVIVAALIDILGRILTLILLQRQPSILLYRDYIVRRNAAALERALGPDSTADVLALKPSILIAERATKTLPLLLDALGKEVPHPSKCLGPCVTVSVLCDASVDVPTPLHVQRVHSTHIQGSPAKSTGLSVGLTPERSWVRFPEWACLEAGGASRTSRAPSLRKSLNE